MCSSGVLRLTESKLSISGSVLEFCSEVGPTGYIWICIYVCVYRYMYIFIYKDIHYRELAHTIIEVQKSQYLQDE